VQAMMKEMRGNDTLKAENDVKLSNKKVVKF
jgi:hypothetical protein